MVSREGCRNRQSDGSGACVAFGLMDGAVAVSRQAVQQDHAGVRSGIVGNEEVRGNVSAGRAGVRQVESCRTPDLARTGLVDSQREPRDHSRTARELRRPVTCAWVAETTQTIPARVKERERTRIADYSGDETTPGPWREAEGTWVQRAWPQCSTGPGADPSVRDQVVLAPPPWPEERRLLPPRSPTPVEWGDVHAPNL